MYGCVKKAALQLLQDSLILLIYTFNSKEQEQVLIILKNLTTIAKLLSLLNAASSSKLLNY